MENLIMFRNDDINPNTDLSEVGRMYDVIKDRFPRSTILSCVTLFAGNSDNGAIYNTTPFKDKPIEFFYNIEKSFDTKKRVPGDIIASHGLIHVDHSAISYDAQRMSIVSSCSILQTKIFIPPFNRYNEDTLLICEENGLDMYHDMPWKSIEFNTFDKNHTFWYFHSWKWELDKFKRALNGSSEHLG